MEHEVLDTLYVSSKYKSQQSALWKHTQCSYTHRIGGQFGGGYTLRSHFVDPGKQP